MSLDWWRALPDGLYVAYGLSLDSRDLPERIANTKSANPQGLDDDSGFFYNGRSVP